MLGNRAQVAQGFREKDQVFKQSVSSLGRAGKQVCSLLKHDYIVRDILLKTLSINSQANKWVFLIGFPRKKYFLYLYIFFYLCFLFMVEKLCLNENKLVFTLFIIAVAEFQRNLTVISYKCRSTKIMFLFIGYFLDRYETITKM